MWRETVHLNLGLQIGFRTLLGTLCAVIGGFGLYAAFLSRGARFIFCWLLCFAGLAACLMCFSWALYDDPMRVWRGAHG